MKFIVDIPQLQVGEDQDFIDAPEVSEMIAIAISNLFEKPIGVSVQEVTGAALSGERAGFSR